MFTAKFAYNEPGIGEIDIEGPRNIYTEEDLIKLIEEKYPAFVDIEIIETQSYD